MSSQFSFLQLPNEIILEIGFAIPASRPIDLRNLMLASRKLHTLLHQQLLDIATTHIIQADIGSRFGLYDTVFSWALQNNRISLLRELLSHVQAQGFDAPAGAMRYTVIRRNRSTHLARVRTKEQSLSAIRRFVSNADTAAVSSLMAAAVMYDKVAAVPLLCEFGGEIKGNPWEQMRCWKDPAAMAGAILAAGFDVNLELKSAMRFMKTALHHAVHYLGGAWTSVDGSEVVRVLLEKGADVQAVDQRGKTSMEILLTDVETAAGDTWPGENTELKRRLRGTYWGIADVLVEFGAGVGDRGVVEGYLNRARGRRDEEAARWIEEHLLKRVFGVSYG